MNAPDLAVNVFDFLHVRSARAVSRGSYWRRFVRDVLLRKDGLHESDLFSAASTSAIGKQIYGDVFCSPGGAPLPASLVWTNVLQSLPSIGLDCPHPSQPGQLETLGQRNYLHAFQRYFLLPGRLEDVNDTLCRKLRVLLPLLEAPPLGTDGQLDVASLRRQLRELFDGSPLYLAAFDPDAASYSVSFAAARRALFDTLYVLYILRRYARVDLEEIITALGALHALEALAWDDLLNELSSRWPGGTAEQALFGALQAIFPQLADWRGGPPPEGFPLIEDLAGLTAHLSASPIIHPIFAQLHRFRAPLSNLRPIGVGDLKVVKQWLCKYRPTEIAYIENVLDGEERSRVHRRLERSEDTVSFADERSDETQRDMQSTDRFELKREAEQAIKSDINLNANASLTYRGAAVVVTAGAGMAYSRSQTDQMKAAANYSREVLDKAVKRVQTRVSQQRTSTRLFESEETNTHVNKSTPGAGHVSGIYRWLEKVYRAQLYNYGKRMMFELVLPEPAAFLVESRMRAFEAGLELPTPPTPPADVAVAMPVSGPLDIDFARFEVLARDYDLSAFEYPAEKRFITFLDPASGQPLLKREGLPNARLDVASFRADASARGYDLVGLSVEGHGEFQGHSELEPQEANLLRFHINGVEVHTYSNDIASWFTWFPSYQMSFTPFEITQDETTLTVGMNDGAFYWLTARGELHLSTNALHAWQRRVYRAIEDIEERKAATERARVQQAYDTRLSVYHNRLEQLRAVAINDLLQGQSAAANRDSIMTELKRQCISMIARELDADASDDFIGSIDAVGERRVDVLYRRLVVTELPNADTPTRVTAEFAKEPHAIDYPLPRVDESAMKGRTIQFLEQAFEWQQLAWIFYPYFWAKDSKWIELMNRQDAADPSWTAFLRAGSAKVLLAVTPAYDDAVLHFLATGEPWEGGPAPVIGDPLFVPLYEELRAQQDDLAGATPEGEPWTFTVPTALVYLENSSTPLPPSVCPDLP